MNKRFSYILLTILCFLICILIVLLFWDYPTIRGFIGDIVVVFLIFFFIKSFWDFSSWKVALFSTIFAYCIEILQYFQLVKILWLEHNTIARIVLGSTFDIKDLLAYTIGGITTYLIDFYITKKN